MKFDENNRQNRRYKTFKRKETKRIMQKSSKRISQPQQVKRIQCSIYTYIYIYI